MCLISEDEHYEYYCKNILNARVNRVKLCLVKYEYEPPYQKKLCQAKTVRKTVVKKSKPKYIDPAHEYDNILGTMEDKETTSFESSGAMESFGSKTINISTSTASPPSSRSIGLSKPKALVDLPECQVRLHRLDHDKAVSSRTTSHGRGNCKSELSVPARRGKRSQSSSSS